MSQATVLVVDDDPDIRETLVETLEQEGYRAIPAQNGVEALVALRDGPPPCLILLDLMMPLMNGWQFRALQQHEPRWAGIPVVILSSADHAVEQAASMGACAYLRKPVDLYRLLDTVQRWTGFPGRANPVRASRAPAVLRG
jgi:CheY-like chemotaxis protein